MTVTEQASGRTAYGRTDEGSEILSAEDGKPWVIALVGPTAVGKTGVAIELAKELGTEIFSCDARQFYEGMAIGTAQPTEAERGEVRHHFVNFIEVGSEQAEGFSAGRFADEAVAAIAEFQRDEPKGRPALVLGGSGLYVKALLEGLDETPRSTEVRAELTEWHGRNGLAPLLEELAERDPVHFQKIDKANPQRIIRALEVCRVSGRAFSSFHSEGPAAQRPFRVVVVGLEMERSELNKRIDERVLGMVAEGWENEAKSLLQHKDSNALQTLGYREWFAHFEENTTDMDVKKCLKTLSEARKEFKYSAVRV